MGKFRYALTEGGTLVDVDELLIYSPSRKSWSRPSFPVAEILDARCISDEKAKELIKAGTTRDPYEVPK